MRYAVVLGGLVLVAGLGCTLSSNKPAGAPAQDEANQRPDAGADEAPAAGADFRGGFKKVAARAPAAKEERGRQQAKAAPRKIIYTASVEMVVADLDEGEAGLLELLEEYGGDVDKADVQTRPGVPRRGTWTVRVPAARFRTFLRALARLGELRHNTLDTSNITDSYYNLQADIKNLEAREAALRALYAKKVAGDKLAALLEVDREVFAVRGEINKARKQIQRWDNEVAYSTAVVTLHDRKDYRPPVEVAYTTRLGQAWVGSLGALVETGKFLVLAAVALAPWLAVLGVLGVPLLLALRRSRRRQVLAAPAGTTPLPPGE
jgi:hypothetical protein